jgi:glucokinase
MGTPRGYVIISGLPGSGKSTLARRLAPALGLPLLDKDDVLEALFDSLGVGDADWRRRLSRSADEVLRRLAAPMDGAVLASWWRHPKAEGESGTPVEWLSSLPGKLVEVHCVCEPGIAAERFLGRTRHAGHLDSTKSPEDLAADFERAAAFGPLGVGPVVHAGTEGEGSGFDGLVRDILARLQSAKIF